MKTNLKTETIKAIEQSGHAPDQIIFIGSEESGHQCSWLEFCEIADKEYDSGYGGQEVATDLVIVFNDGQKLWRGEHDGSEWWAFLRPFVMSDKKAISGQIKKLFTWEAGSCGWKSVAEINE